MTPKCGRCGSRSIAHVNGVGRQCLMCGHEHVQEGRDGAVVVLGDEGVVRVHALPRGGMVMTVRAAAAASDCRSRLVLAWARNGELQATDWDPRQSRRGRLVSLDSLRELVKTKKTVVCSWCGRRSLRGELPRGKARRFCRPPAKCKALYWARHRRPLPNVGGGGGGGGRVV